MEYCIVVCMEAAGFTELVRKQLAEGWVLHGPLIVSGIPRMFVREMIKDVMEADVMKKLTARVLSEL